MTTAASSARPSATDGEDNSIQVDHQGSTIVITLRDQLDAEAGRLLLARATTAVTTAGASRLDLDLRELGSFTPEGARTLVVCRALGAGLPEGLHYRTGRGAGRDALLAAYRELETEVRS